MRVPNALRGWFATALPRDSIRSRPPEALPLKLQWLYAMGQLGEPAARLLLACPGLYPQLSKRLARPSAS